jgi:gliding motility-associatede transport system auxiliary component
MGVKAWPRTAPWWLTWLLVSGLVLLFLGERIMVSGGAGRLVASGAGGLAVLGALAWRFRSWRHATGDGKSVEGMLLLTSAGCALAVIGFTVSSEDGMSLFGISFRDAAAEHRYQVIVQVLSSIILAISLLPALGAQWALAAHRYAGAAATQVESLRVRDIATGALTVALATATLFLAGYITSDRDATLDFSYFKTASPGEGTQEVVRNMGAPVRALLFFPNVNEVKDEVERYFRALASETGGVEVEAHDRMVDADLAREQRVSADGTIVLLRGDRSERLAVSPEIRSARSVLRDFDRLVQERLIRLAREVQVAYLTVGHDELNEPLPSLDDGPTEDDPFRGTMALREILRLLNYRVQDLGLRQGLGSDVPADAGLVMVLGPRRAFLEGELDALDRYAARGGALLLALDPTSDFQLGPLADRLEITFHKELLADDREYVRRRGNPSDRQYIVTDRFSAHESVTTLSQTRVGAGIVLAGSGYLEGPGRTAADTSTVKQTFVVRSLPSTFADLNGNFQFDSGTEQRRVYNLVAAIEGPPLPATDIPATPVVTAGAPPTPPTPTPPQSPREMRALVYANAAMFSDAVLTSVALNAALVADGVRWLGGEGAVGGTVESEEDVRIVHTNAEDVAWFYSTILGAPLIVLAAGFANVVRRRRKGKQAA